MKIQATNYSIAEIRDMFQRKDLVVNEDYQRGTGFWPAKAKTYFIDTILNGFPFPKVYFFEELDRKSKKIKREIVDGQQRIMTILDFLGDSLQLSDSSRKFRGRKFSTLDEEVQISFLSYSVPVDMILAADRPEILEMFRRMNSFTLPLNPAEKRHSGFQGEFKWFINDLADEFSPMLTEFGVLTRKQVVRMADSELITELCQLLMNGIVNKSDGVLRELYATHDVEFANKDEIRGKVSAMLTTVREQFSYVANTFASKSYVLYSLCAALAYNHGWLAGDAAFFDAPPEGRFVRHPETARRGIVALASAHEARDEDGEYGEYVKACASSTHRVAQRTTRAKWLLRALQGELRGQT